MSLSPLKMENILEPSVEGINLFLSQACSWISLCVDMYRLAFVAKKKRGKFYYEILAEPIILTEENLAAVGSS